jgi:hypothetical protein
VLNYLGNRFKEENTLLMVLKAASMFRMVSYHVFAMKHLKRELKKAARRIKRVLRINIKKRVPITVPRVNVWERKYPDEVPGWESKGRYRNSGESPMKGEKSTVMIHRLNRKPKRRKPIVYSLAYLNENLPVSVKDVISRDPRIEPEY